MAVQYISIGRDEFVIFDALTRLAISMQSPFVYYEGKRVPIEVAIYIIPKTAKALGLSWIPITYSQN